MIIQVYFFQVAEDIIKNGFIYNNERYVLFSASAGQIRTKKFVVIKEKLLKQYEKTLMCGLTVDEINKKGGVNVNKFLAYYALANSATEEWADFINGKEWGAVLDLFHSLKNSAKTEKSGAILKKIDNTEILKKDEKQVIKDKLKAIAKRYAGRDYRFTIMEYNVMLNDLEYQALKNKLNQLNQDFE
jgi:hypothetical protein